MQILDNGVRNVGFTTGNDDKIAPKLGASLYANHVFTVFSADEYLKAGQGAIILDNGKGDRRQINVNDTQKVKFFSASNVSGALTFGSNVSIELTQALIPNQNYSVHIDASAFTDLAGNPFALSRDFPQTVLSDGSVASGGPKVTRYQQQTDNSWYLRFDLLSKIVAGSITLSNKQGDSRRIDMLDSSQITTPAIDERGLVNGSAGRTYLQIAPTSKLLPGQQYQLHIPAGALTDLISADASADIDITLNTSSISPAYTQTVTEINHGKQLGKYEAGDVLVFNFFAPIQSYQRFTLNQHTFGSNDVIFSTDGMSASVTLDANSSVAVGDVLTLVGCKNRAGEMRDVAFNL